MKTFIPDALRSYTGGASCVEAGGGTLDELLNDLDRQFPGIRFRMIDEQDVMRPHVAFFVGGIKTRNLAESLVDIEEVVIMQALSGG